MLALRAWQERSWDNHRPTPAANHHRTSSSSDNNHHEFSGGNNKKGGDCIVRYNSNTTIDKSDQTNNPIVSGTSCDGRPGCRTVPSAVEKLKFEIPNFAQFISLYAKGEYVPLPSQSAHGHDWSLHVYPRGHERSSTDTEYVSVILRWMRRTNGEKEEEDDDNRDDIDDNERDEATGDGAVSGVVDTVFAVELGPIRTESANMRCQFSSTRSTYGWENFIKRKRLLTDETLLPSDGTLVLVVAIQVYTEEIVPPVWYPATPTMLFANLLEPPYCCSDVTVLVDHQEFRLHRCILAGRARPLYDLIGYQTLKLVVVDVDTFHIMVRYIYTAELPSVLALTDLDRAKALLTASRRFGCTGLLLWVESVIVDKFLTENNAAELLLLGDALSCALLKEAAIHICKEYSVVTSSPGWAAVKESTTLLAEVLAGAPRRHRHRRGSKRGQHSNEKTDVEELSVGELRDRLLRHQHGGGSCCSFDDDEIVDGSRETLMHRLRALEGRTASQWWWK